MTVNFNKLTTEQVNKNSSNIDTCSTREMLQIINDEDKLVAIAVEKELDNIALAVDTVYHRLKDGGRLFYVGAGTSGRIGLLDAAECPPTYGVEPELVQGIIAGGNKAMFKAVEGAEDNEQQGRSIITEKGINTKDVVIGISASGSAPYVIGAIKQAQELGIDTIAISNNSESIIKGLCEVSITPLVGPEVVMGSTRMKAGTSQKLILNMITTGVMIKLGKVYGNLMVDLQPTNKKLVDRSIRIVMLATGVNKDIAKDYMEKSEGKTKVAIVMIKTGLDNCSAIDALNKANGSVSEAIRISK